MTYDMTISTSGELLAAHLAGYGLAWLLHELGHEVWLRHDAEAQDFDIQLTTNATEDAVVDAVVESTRRLAAVIELDIEPGRTGNDRRAVMWSRASFKGSPERAAAVLASQRDECERSESDRLVAGWVAGLGFTGAWLADPPGPAGGSTALDGVLGNHTSDFVRGAARRLRVLAASAPQGAIASALQGDQSGAIADRTAWAPPGTSIDPIMQWLAVLGLALFPVGQVAGPRTGERAVTPAFWPRGRGVTLPLLDEWTSTPRLRGLVSLGALPVVNTRSETDAMTVRRATSVLRAHGIKEVVAFGRINKPGSGSSVAFSFGRATRIEL